MKILSNTHKSGYITLTYTSGYPVFINIEHITMLASCGNDGTMAKTQVTVIGRGSVRVREAIGEIIAVLTGEQP